MKTISKMKTTLKMKSTSKMKTISFSSLCLAQAYLTLVVFTTLIVGASNRPTKIYSCLFDFFAVVSLDPFAGASYSCTGSEIVCQEFFLKTRLSSIESLPKKVVVIVVGVVFVVHGLVVVIGVVVIVGNRNLTLKFGQNWVNDQ